MSAEEKEFRAFVDGLFIEKRAGVNGFMHASAGLAGESGEVLDLMKKVWVYSRPLNTEKTIEEMGDVLHYFFQMMIKLTETGTDVSLKDIMNANMAKLRKRYPDGFTKEAAIARADKS